MACYCAVIRDPVKEGWFSRQYAFDDLTVNIGQTKTASLILEGEPLVVDAHQVQEGGVEVVDVDAVFSDVVAELVGGTKSDSGSYSAAGHPCCETTRVMIPPVVVRFERAL